MEFAQIMNAYTSEERIRLIIGRKASLAATYPHRTPKTRGIYGHQKRGLT